jgi:hypothetical protein
MAGITFTPNESNPSPVPGFASVMFGTITWDSSTLVTGELLNLSTYFEHVKGIVHMGWTTIAAAVYPVEFSFDPAAVVTSSNVLAYLLRDPDPDLTATGPLVIADGLDAAALGTSQVMIIGERKI